MVSVDVVLCLAVVWLARVLRHLWSVAWRSIDHQMEAFFSSRKLRDIMFRVRPTDMLLHRSVSFLLMLGTIVSDADSVIWLGEPLIDPNDDESSLARGAGQLTPMQRFLQLEPSWLRNGQTTSLFESVIENDPMRDDLGGIVKTPPCAGYRYR